MTTGVSAGALILAAVMILTYQIGATRTSEVTRLEVLAKVLAANSTAAIVFGDSNAASEVLNALAVESNISQALIQTPDGRIFVRYKSNPALPDSDALQKVMNEPHLIQGNTLYLRQPIALHGSNLGTLYIESDLVNIQSTIRNFAEVLLIAITFALIITAVLGSKLQAIVSAPIRKLTSSMKSISASGDYSVRVPVDSNDELGTLVSGFNKMLAEVQLRDRQLKDHRDLLEERVAERTRDISLAIEHAEEASRLKSQFLANMSHEIRTPMNGMLGMADLLFDMDPTPAQHEYLRIIQQSGKHLLNLVNDILDFSKIEAGQLHISAEPFDLREFLTGIEKPLEAQAISKGLALEVKIKPDVPDALIGDSYRVGQILVNLVGNAIKFTSIGKIILLVENDGPRESKHCLRFSVIDTGPGIPIEKQEHIFEAFSQADGSVTRKFGGTGLGLSISTQLAVIMDGKISMVSPIKADMAHSIGLPLSEEYPGSAFILSLPLAAQSKTDEAKRKEDLSIKKEITRESKRILVAEDNLVNQKLVKEILRRSGHEVTLVSNGQKALDAIAGYLETGRNCPFDLILMDLQMPVLDGLSATQAIRKCEQGLPRMAHLPIVALTAHAFDQDKNVCLKNGMDAFVTKPIYRQELLQIIDQLTAR